MVADAHGGDWAYSIVYLLGGEYAARMLNFAMLLIAEACCTRRVRRWVSPAAAFLLAASFAATPLVQLVTGSLFVENFLTAVVLAMVTVVWLFAEAGERRWLFAAALLAGTAVTTKYGVDCLRRADSAVRDRGGGATLEIAGVAAVGGVRGRGLAAVRDGGADLRDCVSQDRESDLPVSESEIPHAAAGSGRGVHRCAVPAPGRTGAR